MSNEVRLIPDYAPRAGKAQPLRVWVPILFLAAAVAVWHRPRLTPTFFPTALDLTMLAWLIVGAILIARLSSLPGWAFLVFGAVGDMFFLLANFEDNNFRAENWPLLRKEVAVGWCSMGAAGAAIARVIAVVGRVTSKVAAVN